MVSRGSEPQFRQTASVVHLTAYKFEAISFEEDYQFAQFTLELGAGTDPAFLEAYNKITDQFDGTFYQECVTALQTGTVVV